jgi:hypothetical protein
MARKIAAQRALSSVDDATQLDSARVDALRSMPSNQIQSIVEAAVSVSKENTPRAGASRDENLFESTGNAAEDEVLAQLQVLFVDCFFFLGLVLYHFGFARSGAVIRSTESPHSCCIEVCCFIVWKIQICSFLM